MRRYIYIYIAVVAAAFAAACSKGGDSFADVGYGSITILSEVNNQVLDNTAAGDDDSNKFVIPSDLIPSVDDLKLHVTGSYINPENRKETLYDQEFANATEFNATASILWSGDYVATLDNGVAATDEGEDKAHFGSVATPFIVVKGEYNSDISLDVELANSIIRVRCSEWFKKYFSAATFTITTSEGNEFEFDPFDADNDDYIVFVAAGSELRLKGVASRINGSDITFVESTVATTVASRMTTLVVDAEDIGEAKINVTINSKIIETDKHIVDLNPLND